jgi:hypothetical protein
MAGSTMGDWPPGHWRMSSTSTSRRAFLESSQPPVSSGAFQDRPQSSRLTSVQAENAARWPPQGSWVAPWNSRSQVTGLVLPMMVSSPSSCQRLSSLPGARRWRGR